MTERQPSPFDKLGATGLILQILLLMGVGAAVLHVVAPAAFRASPSSDRAMGTVFYLTVLALLAFRGWRARLDWRVLFGGPPPRGELPLLAVVAPVALLTVGAAIAVYVPLSYVAPHFVERMVRSGSLLDTRTVRDWLALVLVGVIAAPLAEELLFRGFFLHRWARRWGTTTGVVVSSALFALLHGEWVGHFVFGVAMAALYLRTRRLWMPIAAHAMNNGVLTIFSLADLVRGAPAEQTSLAEIRGAWPWGIAATVAGALLFWWYLRRWWPEGQWRTVLRGPTPYETGGREDGRTGGREDGMS